MKDNEIVSSSLSKLTMTEKFRLMQERISDEIETYIKKTQISELELSKQVGVSHRTIYAWRENNYTRTPLRENINKLAKFLNINPLYLLADSNRRLNDINQIELEELVQDNGLLGLQRLKREFEFSKENDEYITYIDLNYVDIISTVIGDVEFWKTLIHEASRLIRLQTKHYEQARFENTINKEDIVDNPTKLSYDELVHQVNAKAINKAFDKYVSNKKKELEITEQYYEERMNVTFNIPEE